MVNARAVRVDTLWRVEIVLIWIVWVRQTMGNVLNARRTLECFLRWIYVCFMMSTAGSWGQESARSANKNTLETFKVFAKKCHKPLLFNLLKFHKNQLTFQQPSPKNPQIQLNWFAILTASSTSPVDASNALTDIILVQKADAFLWIHHAGITMSKANVNLASKDTLWSMDCARLSSMLIPNAGNKTLLASVHNVMMDIFSMVHDAKQSMFFVPLSTQTVNVWPVSTDFLWWTEIASLQFEILTVNCSILQQIDARNARTSTSLTPLLVNVSRSVLCVKITMSWMVFAQTVLKDSDWIMECA